MNHLQPESFSQFECTFGHGCETRFASQHPQHPQQQQAVEPQPQSGVDDDLVDEQVTEFPSHIPRH